MPEGADGSRRRELELRAYAPDGGLTDAEAAELQALTVRTPVAGSPEPSTAVPERLQRDQAPEQAEPSIPVPEQTQQDAAPSGAAQRGEGRHWLLSVAAVVVLLLGFGGGWLAFGRGDVSPAIPGDQVDALAELEKTDEYDPSSLEYVGERDGATVWRGTRDAGAFECIVLTVGTQVANTCASREDENLTVGGLSVSLQSDEDGTDWRYWATILTDIDGRATAVLHRSQFELTQDWSSRFTPEEIELARVLEDEGVDPNMLNIVGYDGDRPIWAGYSDGECLYVVEDSTQVHRACVGARGEEPLTLTVDDTEYSLSSSQSRPPVLTITRVVEAPNAG